MDNSKTGMFSRANAYVPTAGITYIPLPDIFNVIFSQELTDKLTIKPNYKTNQ